MECEIDKVYSAVERVARKKHVCCECGVAIDKGEKYLNCSGIWSYGAETNKQHLICAEACEIIRDKIDNECIPFGYLIEWYHDAGMDYVPRDADGVADFRSLMAKILWRRYKS
jgi:hypothetical protein